MRNISSKRVENIFMYVIAIKKTDRFYYGACSQSYERKK